MVAFTTVVYGTLVPILSNFMLVGYDEKILNIEDSSEMSSKSSHEFIIHPNLVSTTSEKKSEFGILWTMFDNLIMKPYFIYKFSSSNG